MFRPPYQSCDHQSADNMRNERLRMRMELVEVIASARDTIDRSWLLLAEADGILAREKLPLLGRPLPWASTVARWKTSAAEPPSRKRPSYAPLILRSLRMPSAWSPSGTSVRCEECRCCFPDDRRHYRRRLLVFVGALSGMPDYQCH
jgi:hypothetical protein